MIELLSDNPLLKYLLLVSLFAIVSVGAYFASLAFGARQVARQRLVEAQAPGEQGTVMGSLRTDRVERRAERPVAGRVRHHGALGQGSGGR